MPYNRNTLIYILTPKVSYIPPLRQNGPITNPLRVPCRVVEKCLQIGVPISEYDPNTKQVIKLTPLNLYDDKKFEQLVKETLNVSTRGTVKQNTEDNKLDIPDAVIPPVNIQETSTGDNNIAEAIDNFNETPEVHGEFKNDKKKYRRDHKHDK